MVFQGIITGFSKSLENFKLIWWCCTWSYPYEILNHETFPPRIKWIILLFRNGRKASMLSKRALQHACSWKTCLYNILSPADREMLSLGTVIRGCSNMYFHGCYYVSNLVKLSVQRQQIVGQVNRPLEFCSLSTRAQRLCLSSSNTSMNTANKSNDITMKVWYAYAFLVSLHDY